MMTRTEPGPRERPNVGRLYAMWLRRVAILAVCALTLGGCGLVAAPCRVGSAALKIVPIAGDVAAAPTDACANVIDPTPTRS